MKNINIPKVLTKGIFKDKIRIACFILTERTPYDFQDFGFILSSWVVYGSMKTVTWDDELFQITYSDFGQQVFSVSVKIEDDVMTEIIFTDKSGLQIKCDHHDHIWFIRNDKVIQEYQKNEFIAGVMRSIVADLMLAISAFSE